MLLARLDNWTDNGGYDDGGGGLFAPTAAYIAVAAVPGGYTDISSIENWVTYYSQVSGTVGMKDWKCLEAEIKALALTICVGDLALNWGNLSAEEQLICCQNILSIVPPAQFIATVPAVADRQSYSMWFDEQNKNARKNYRIHEARMYLFNKVGTANALLAFDQADTDSLIMKYDGGVDGTVESGGIVGITDFVQSRAGTPYAANGLSLKAYPIVDGSGLNMVQVAQGVYDILVNGTY